MAFEIRVEVKPRGNSEALERSSKNGDVNVGRAHDDSHFAKGPSGRGLLDDPAGDLLRFAVDRWRLHQRAHGSGACTLGTFFAKSHRGEAQAKDIGQIVVAYSKRD